jgi:hypothetical protein
MGIVAARRSRPLARSKCFASKKIRGPSAALGMTLEGRRAGISLAPRNPHLLAAMRPAAFPVKFDPHPR